MSLSKNPPVGETAGNPPPARSATPGVAKRKHTAETKSTIESPAFTDGSVTKLADYGTVQFTHALADRIGGETIKPVDGDTISMTENGKKVSTAAASGETVTCTFV